MRFQEKNDGDLDQETVAGKGRSVNSRDIQGIRCGKRQE